MTYHGMGQTAPPPTLPPGPVTPVTAPTVDVATTPVDILSKRRGFVAVPTVDLRDYVQAQVVTMGIGFIIGVTVGAALGNVVKGKATIAANRRRVIRNPQTLRAGSILTLRRRRTHAGVGAERVVTRTVSRIVWERGGIVAVRFAEVSDRVFQVDVEGRSVFSARPKPLVYEIEHVSGGPVQGNGSVLNILTGSVVITSSGREAVYTGAGRIGGRPVMYVRWSDTLKVDELTPSAFRKTFVSFWDGRKF